MLNNEDMNRKVSNSVRNGFLRNTDRTMIFLMVSQECPLDIDEISQMFEKCPRYLNKDLKALKEFYIIQQGSDGKYKVSEMGKLLLNTPFGKLEEFVQKATEKIIESKYD